MAFVKSELKNSVTVKLIPLRASRFPHNQPKSTARLHKSPLALSPKTPPTRLSNRSAQTFRHDSQE